MAPTPASPAISPRRSYFDAPFFGAVLTPYAAVVNSSPLHGTLIAASLIQHDTIHLPELAAALPGRVALGRGSSGGTVAVSEPKALALFATGLLVFLAAHLPVLRGKPGSRSRTPSESGKGPDPSVPGRPATGAGGR